MRLALLFLLIAIFACDTHYGQYQYTRLPVADNCTTIPVYVDINFGQADQLSISNALDQWNYTLNNYAKLVIVNNHFNMEPYLIRDGEGQHALFILDVPSNSPLVIQSDAAVAQRDGLGSHSYSLAFTPDFGNRHIYLIRSRLQNQDVFYITMHEIGHALGAHHHEGGLMSPHYNKDGYQCVDKYTSQQVAQFQGWQADKMNYCILGTLSAGAAKGMVDNL